MDAVSNTITTYPPTHLHNPHSSLRTGSLSTGLSVSGQVAKARGSQRDIEGRDHAHDSRPDQPEEATCTYGDTMIEPSTSHITRGMHTNSRSFTQGETSAGEEVSLGAASRGSNDATNVKVNVTVKPQRPTRKTGPCHFGCTKTNTDRTGNPTWKQIPPNSTWWGLPGGTALCHRHYQRGWGYTRRNGIAPSESERPEYDGT